MEWKLFVSTLWTQTSTLNLETFEELSKVNPKTISLSELWKFTQNEKLQKYLKENPAWWERSLRDLKSLEKMGARAFYPGHVDYPEKLLELLIPPLFLSCLGSPAWKTQRCLSVVGSRQASPLSLRWMDLELSRVAAEGFVIVSGGAHGIDQKAHAVALRQKTPTVAFLPSGLSEIYPSEFQNWVEDIVEGGGAIMSELSPSEPMRKYYFLERNRMIAGMSDLLLVVEARRSSGSMMTARLAADNGRQVCILPGFPTEHEWTGNLDLLFSGADPVRDAKDVLGLLG